MFNDMNLPQAQNFFERAVMTYAFQNGERCMHSMKGEDGMMHECFPAPQAIIRPNLPPQKWEVDVICPVCGSRMTETANELLKCLIDMKGYEDKPMEGSNLPLEEESPSV